MKISNMKASNMKAILVTLCALLLVAGAFAQQSHPADRDHATPSQNPTDDTDGTPGVITGYVRDVACLVQNPKAGAATTPVAKDCLEKCVRGGSPLVILSEDGFLYVPISSETPDKSVRSQTIALRRQVREGKRQTLRARRPAFNLNRENRANHQTPQLQNPHFLRSRQYQNRINTHRNTPSILLA